MKNESQTLFINVKQVLVHVHTSFFPIFEISGLKVPSIHENKNSDNKDIFKNNTQNFIVNKSVMSTRYTLT